MRVALSAMVLLACTEPAASGAVILELAEERVGRDVIDARMATEIEVLEGSVLADRVRQRLELADSPVVEASRRSETLVLDVAVLGNDRERAREICNHVLDVYIEQRMYDQLAPLDGRLQHLYSNRDLLPDGPTRARIDEALVELELERAAVQPGARVLERCARR